MRFVVGFLILFLMSYEIAQAKSKFKSPLQANTLWVKKELQKIGLSEGFISESMKYYEPHSFDPVVTLNLLGFLRPPGEHMNRVTAEAVRETANFVKENQKSFDIAAEKFEVPANVISALLWIETRHGEDTGKFHTVSVYMHLLQSRLKKNRAQLFKTAWEKVKKDQTYTKKELRKIITERTKRKSLWAQEQIIALASIRKKKHLDIKNLRGSYAGAFGLPQFIPSSYKEYAKALDPKLAPNLMSVTDTVLSVANYLALSGWKNTEGDAQIGALMKYNNSRDYAESILDISRQALAANPGLKLRGLSSEKEKEL